jgi:hypothetical protein
VQQAEVSSAPMNKVHIARDTITFYVIIGLPSSGKTTLAHKWAHGYGVSCMVFDDLTKFLPDYVARFRAAASKPPAIIVTDPKMCGVPEDVIKGFIRNKFDGEGKNWTFRFYYFANDPEACLENCKYRTDRPEGVKDFIRHWTKAYVIPEHAEVMPVYKRLN